jgi:HlyD family secretion protein
MPNPETIAAARSIRRHMAGGLLVCLLLVCGGGGWAAVTSLAGAVVASGHFVVDSYVKKVQHPKGGVVGEILVQEGDAVKAGAVVMRLDATQTHANLAIVTKRLNELQARLARLEAERDDREAIAFPAGLLEQAAGDPDAAAAVRSETRLFEFRRQSREGKKAQLRERIEQYGHEIEGLKAQEVAYASGLDVLRSEIASQEGLHDRGIVSVQRLNSLKTQAATYDGERGEKIAFQAQAEGKITETRLQILQVDQDVKTEVGRELREIQGQVGEYVERKVAAEDDLRRIDILAPQAGIVHQLAVHTVGGVVNPAEPVMLIVPECVSSRRTSTRSGPASGQCSASRPSASAPRRNSMAASPASPRTSPPTTRPACPSTSCASPSRIRSCQGSAASPSCPACRRKP